MSQMETRRFWLALHRYVGLVTLVFLALAGATGSVLCFDKPLDAALNPDLFGRTSARAIEPFAAVRGFEAAHPGVRVLSFPLHVGPGRALPAEVGSRATGAALGYDQVFLDGSNGHVRGVRQIGPGWDRRHLVRGVYLFHYTLLAGAWGRWFMGLVAFAWLLSNLIGLYLTFPTKGAFLKQWLKTWTFKTTSPLPRLLLDLHRASGLWVLILITVLAFTSVNMNFFDELFTPAVNSISPARPSPFDRASPPVAQAPRLDFEQALSDAEAAAARRGLHLTPAKISYDPDRNLYGVMFTDSGVENYHRLGPVSLYVGGGDGRLVYEDDPYTDSAGRKLSRALYPLHTGQVAGPIGVAVDFVLGLATVEMSVTGAYLWWKRRPPRVAARRARLAAKRAAA